MAGHRTLGILSDIHYASAAEQARGNDYELRNVANPMLRVLAKAYRRHIWLREPMSHNDLLDRFLAQAGDFDFGIANGDYSCDSANVGASDDAAWQSMRECLAKLQGNFGDRLRATYGDHELGRMGLVGRRGGMRLASWERLGQEPGLPPFWKLEIGNYVLLGIVSSLVALPIFEADTLPAERPKWQQLRDEHMALIRETFEALGPEQRVLLFCHDPTALPFLWREEAVRVKLPQLEQTIIGHLHSRLILWKSGWLAGMPKIGFLGHTAKRLSAALNEAQFWRPFHVRLCPAIAGIQLLKDGGYLSADLDLEAKRPATFQFHRLACK
jgi:hypothetical protein